MRFLPNSIRRKMLWSLLIAMTLLLGTVGILSLRVAQHEVDEIFGARLATSARVLESLVARQIASATLVKPIVIELPERIKGQGGDTPQAAGHPYENKIAFQIWTSEGTMLARSSSAPVLQLSPFTAGFHHRRVEGARWEVFVLKSGDLWVMAAERDEVQQEIIREITSSIVMPLVIGGLVLLIVVNIIALRALKPVETLALNIANRDPTSLQPIVLAREPQELTPVVGALNMLLSRIKQAFSREKRLIDAAAHELRTPITAVHLHIQNACQASNEAEKDESLRNALEASRRAARLAEQMLVFSRISASADQEARQALQLQAECQDVVRMMQPILDSYQQRVRVDCRADPVVVAEKSKIERLLRNLIENAAQYGVKPGQIDLTVDQTETSVMFSVENDGPAIPDIEKARIFIPYYRVVGNAAFGSGLGLSIAQEIVQQLQGSIQVQDRTPGQGARFLVTLPRSA